ncbi:MAG: class II aldolase/adducin family protein [Thermoplasmata archaeon]
MFSEGRLKDQLLAARKVLIERRVLSRSSHGDLSGRLDAQSLVVSDVADLGELTRDRMATVGLSGRPRDGALGPIAAEMVPLHSAVYQTRPATGAIVHCHPPKATAFAVAGRPIPAVYEGLFRFGVTDEIPVAPWAPRTRPELVSNVLAQMDKHPGAPAVLLGNDGLLAFGPDPVAAALLAAVIEEAAEILLDAHLLGEAKPLPLDAGAWEEHHSSRRPSG